MRTLKFRGLLTLIASLMLVAAACSDDSSTSSASGDTGSTGSSVDTVCASADMTTGDALAKVCESGTLRVATDPKYKPQSWYDVQSGEWNGFDVEVAEEIASRMGVEAELQAQKWGVITAGSWNDRWDVSVGSMTDTIDREGLFFFTPAYYFTPAVIAVHSDNTSITGPADLTGKTVCVGVSTTYQDYVQGSLVLGSAAPPFDFQIEGANLQTYDTDTDALDNQALGDGARCDAAITAQQTVDAFVADGGPIKIVGDPLYFEPLSIAFDKNAPTDAQSLSDAVGQIVEDMHDDGTLSDLSTTWYDGVDWTTSASDASASPSA